MARPPVKWAGSERSAAAPARDEDLPFSAHQKRIELSSPGSIAESTEAGRAEKWALESDSRVGRVRPGGVTISERSEIRVEFGRHSGLAAQE
jgi:hypothetical protein